MQTSVPLGPGKFHVVVVGHAPCWIRCAILSKIRVVLHTLYIWNEDGDSQFFFCISGTSNSLFDCIKNLKKNLPSGNFRANALNINGDAFTRDSDKTLFLRYLQKLSHAHRLVFIINMRTDTRICNLCDALTAGTLTMLWRNSWSMTRQTHEELTSNC